MSSQEVLLARFMSLFRGRSFRYGVFEVTGLVGNKQEGKARTVSDDLTDQQYRKHLFTDDMAIGVVPLDDDNMCSFAAIDIDQYSNSADLTHRLLTDIKALGIKVVPCRSKSGGLHLYAFFSEPLQPELVIDYMRRVSSLLGVASLLSEKTGELSPVEVFPKQVRAEKTGSWINLPYHNGTRLALNDTGKEVDLDVFLDLAEAKRQSAADLKTFLKKREHEAVLASSDGGDALEGCPPCFTGYLRTQPEAKVGKGARNEMFANILVYLKKRYPSEWEEAALEYNQELIVPPLPDSELKSLIASYRTKDYFYKCNSAPICNFCDKALCRTKEYGINVTESIEFGDLVVCAGEPKSYLWTINGTEIEFDVDDVVAPSSIPFRRKVLDQGGVLLPHKMKMEDVNKMLLDKLKTARHMEFDLEASPRGVLFSHVRNYLEDNQVRKTNMTKAEIYDLVNNHKTCKLKEDGTHVWFFKVTNLLAYLDHMRFREYVKTKIVKILKEELGALSKQTSYAGGDRHLRYWTIDNTLLEAKLGETETYD